MLTGVNNDFSNKATARHFHDDDNSVVKDATDPSDDDNDATATSDENQQQPINQDGIAMHDIEEDDDENEIDEDVEETE